MALNKRWKMPREGHSLQFRWEVFNVPNLHRFNALSGLGTTGLRLHRFAATAATIVRQLHGPANQPRVMQFALRYEF